MSGPTLSAALSLLHSQLAYQAPLPKSSFQGQTAIVTGGNAGLGRQTAKHLARLDVARLILGVRNVTKGEEARVYIEEQTGRKGFVEVWELDLASFASVRAFAERAKGLDRLDVLVNNAGQWPTSFKLAEGYEVTVTTNVISTFFLTKLLLPKMQGTALKTQTLPRITVVDSNLHKFATLPARKSPRIFDEYKKTNKDFDARYNDTKLLVVLYGQKLAADITSSKEARICFTLMNPGWCISSLKPAEGVSARLAERVLVRSTDEGARIIVDAVAADKAEGRHGAYLDDMKVKKPASWIASKEGQETAERVWVELNEILENAFSNTEGVPAVHA